MNRGNVVPFKKKGETRGRKRSPETILFIQKMYGAIDASEAHAISREQIVAIFAEVFPVKAQKLMEKYLQDGQTLKDIWKVPGGVHKYVKSLKNKKRMSLFAWTGNESDKYCRYAEVNNIQELEQAQDALRSKYVQVKQFKKRYKKDKKALDKRGEKISMKTRKQRDKYYESQPGTLFAKA